MGAIMVKKYQSVLISSVRSLQAKLSFLTNRLGIPINSQILPLLCVRWTTIRVRGQLIVRSGWRFQGGLQSGLVNAGDKKAVNKYMKKITRSVTEEQLNDKNKGNHRKVQRQLKTQKKLQALNQANIKRVNDQQRQRQAQQKASRANTTSQSTTNVYSQNTLLHMLTCPQEHFLRLLPLLTKERLVEEQQKVMPTAQIDFKVSRMWNRGDGYGREWVSKAGRGIRRRGFIKKAVLGLLGGKKKGTETVGISWLGKKDNSKSSSINIVPAFIDTYATTITPNAVATQPTPQLSNPNDQLFHSVKPQQSPHPFQLDIFSAASANPNSKLRALTAASSPLVHLLLSTRFYSRGLRAKYFLWSEFVRETQLDRAVQEGTIQSSSK